MEANQTHLYVRYAKSPNQDQINERKNIDLTHEYLQNIFHNYFHIYKLIS